MSRKGIRVLLLFSILFSLSCKKDKKTETTTTGSGGGTSTPTVYFGILSSLTLQTVTGVTLGPVSTYPSAFFSNSATQYVNTSTAITVDSVKLNNVKFKYNIYQYLDTTYASTFPPAAWSISGNNGIPSFNYANNDPTPGYTGYALLPDTIDRTQATTITLTGLSNYETAQVIITDMSGQLGHSPSLTLAVSANSITFSTASLTPLNAMNNALLVVSVSKKNIQTFSGKAFNFPTEYQLSKYIVIK